MFDLRKIFDLMKIFAVPKDFFKSKIYCTTQALHFSKHLLLLENIFGQSQLHYSFFHLLYSFNSCVKIPKLYLCVKSK